MFLTARKTPYSSVVGQAVVLLDQNGAVVCQLAIMNVRKDLDYETVAGDIASLICLHFNESGK
jgi:uncharacterized protein YhfF